MMEVLILGNGISRLSYDDFIRSWQGEVWGCNRVFHEYGRILSRLAGHTDVMVEAREHRRQNQHEYEIWGGHLGKSHPAERLFTCSKRYQKDTGTTLVAQALHEGHNVAVVGFDLGGPDILSPELEKAPKWNWVDRWRLLLRDFGEHRVRFIGHDHKLYLLSDEQNDAYCHRYLNGKPHIPGPDYIAVWQEFTGRAVKETEDEPMVQVRYKDGSEAPMKDAIAAKMEKKGQIEILKPEKKQQQATTTRTTKKEKVKDDAPVQDN